MDIEFTQIYKCFLKYHAKIEKAGPGKVFIGTGFAPERRIYEICFLSDFWKRIAPYIVNERLKR